MFRVLNCLASDHNWRLVALAVLVSVGASAAALSLLLSARAARGAARAAWIAAAGVAGGGGFWATHFIAIIAYDPPIDVGYDVGLSALSLLVAMAATAAGLGVAVRTTRPRGAAAGGAIVGAGIAAMHFIAMAALELPGRITWSPDLVVAAIVVGVAFTAGALAVAGRNDTTGNMFAAAALLAFGTLGLHFIAMGGIIIVPDPTRVIDPSMLSETMLALTIAGVTSAALSVSIIGAAMDRRLVRREASFRFLFESNPVPMWIWDHATLRFLAVNDAAVAHYGYTRAQFLTMTLDDIKISDTAISAAEAVEGYEARVRERRTSFHVKADGSRIEAMIYGRPMNHEGRAASLVAIVDVTERQRGENELRRMQEFLNTIIDSVPATIAVKNASDLTYVLLNRAGEELLGIARDQIVGKTARDVFDAAAADAIMERDKRMLKSGAAVSEQHAIKTPVKGKRFVGSTRVMIRDESGGHRYLLTVIDDMTERKQAEDELRRTRAFLDAIVENMPAILVVKDTEQRYILVNRAAEDCFGIARSEMIGRHARDIFPDADYVTTLDNEAMQTQDMVQVGEHPVITPRHGTRMLTSKKLILHGEDGAAQYLLSLSEDVTDRARAQRQIAHMARHDTLTDLPNRAAFNEKLAAAFEQASANGAAFAVLCVDLDRFKEINDVFGHSVGDALLCETSRRMHVAADGEFLARLGGDEFTLIIEKDAHHAAAVAERLLATLASEIEVGDNHLRVSMSIGVAVFPADGKDASTLVANADAALYRAKAEGRGSIRFFAAEMDERLRERRMLQHELRSAIGRGELVLHYQPQARIGGEILGFEALVRWRHPTRGMVQPGAFIPLAEESGLIVAIGEWILREACREAASWPHPLQIAVNLSPIQFRHGDLALLLHGILLETGLPAHRLELEITEGVLIGDFSRALSILRRLKALGVRIAMDDFGTGYSSLSYLQSFPFDKIKIDRTFIANLIVNEHSAAIVRAVIGLGRGLNLPVVAEGVETGEQLAFLTREHCDEMQGFLIGRPAPIAAYAEMVGRKAVPKRKAAAG